MFVVHGQSGTMSAIVGTSSLHKAVMHLARMTQAGLSACITDERTGLAIRDICVRDRLNAHPAFVEGDAGLPPGRARRLCETRREQGAHASW